MKALSVFILIILSFSVQFVQGQNFRDDKTENSQVVSEVEILVKQLSRNTPEKAMQDILKHPYYGFAKLRKHKGGYSTILAHYNVKNVDGSNPKIAFLVDFYIEFGYLDPIIRDVAFGTVINVYQGDYYSHRKINALEEIYIFQDIHDKNNFVAVYIYHKYLENLKK